MKSSPWTPIAAVAIVAAALTGLFVSRRNSETQALAQERTNRPTNAAAEKPVRVQVQQPVRKTLNQTVQLPASLIPGDTADLYAKTSGYVANVLVDIGSRVSTGDALVELSVPEMKDSLDQAQALLAARKATLSALQAQMEQRDAAIAMARAEFKRRQSLYTLQKITADRQKKLFDEKAIPEQTYDEAMSRLAVAESEVNIAKAKVRSAQANKQALQADIAEARANVAVEEAALTRLKTLMTYATIHAPFDGVITRRLVDPGAFVRSAAEGISQPLVTIARVNRLRLVLHIPESDAAHVRVGTEIKAVFDQKDFDPIQTRITRTALSLRENTRTMRAEADIDNTEGRLIPGLYARASVSLKTDARALLVPSKSLRIRGSDVSVLVADGTIATAKPIKLGYDDGIWAQVTAGLNGDEQVIVATSAPLAPGAPIAPTILAP